MLDWYPIGSPLNILTEAQPYCPDYSGRRLEVAVKGLTEPPYAQVTTSQEAPQSIVCFSPGLPFVASEKPAQASPKGCNLTRCSFPLLTLALPKSTKWSWFPSYRSEQILRSCVLSSFLKKPSSPTAYCFSPKSSQFFLSLKGRHF